ncbi:MAG: hypothetical protein ABWZ87_05655 [Aeromicrobium sp.]
MKSLLRFAAITIASTALVASGAVSATASSSANTVEAAAPVTATAPVSSAVAPYPLNYKSKLRAQKRGKKITFRLVARYTDDAGNGIGIRRATLQVKKGGKWKTVKHVKLKSNGTGKYKRTDKKKRNYRMVIKATSLYQGGRTVPFKI